MRFILQNSPDVNTEFRGSKRPVEADGQTGLAVQIQPFEVCGHPAGTH